MMTHRRTTISKAPIAIVANDGPLFDLVAEMEDGLSAVRDFAGALELMTDAMGREIAAPVQRLAMEITKRVEGLEKQRGMLFRALHPNRARFERVGWPGDEQPVDEGRVAAAAAPWDKAVTVMLVAAGDKKIMVIKKVREITGLGLKESKDLVEGLPKPIKEGVNAGEAAQVKAILEKEGAKVDLIVGARS